ncbi:MAG: DUF2480 family protein [Bacteroidota bacterium]
MSQTEIINRIALSPLVTFDLADHHDAAERIGIDIAEQLFMGQILREKDFRAFIKDTDWTQYAGKHVHFFCSVDAVIPGWTWMLLSIALEPHAKTVLMGSALDLEKEIWRKILDGLDYGELTDKKIVVKGCGDIQIPDATYVDFIRRLRPIADKLMYGEPCSTVPLYRKPKPRRKK